MRYAAVRDWKCEKFNTSLLAEMLFALQSQFGDLARLQQRYDTIDSGFQQRLNLACEPFARARPWHDGEFAAR